MSTRMGPRPLVLCGPSGSGKSTILNKLIKDYPNSFGFCVSHTTRKPRPGEAEGHHYHFTDRATMEAAIEAGEFIECAEFSGNMYGTSKTSVRSILTHGKICVLDIDVQGVKQVRKTDLNPWYIFLKPPTLTELENRLRARKTESEDSLAMRMENAEKEIEYGVQPGNFDLVIVNDKLDGAYGRLKEFIEKQVLQRKDTQDEMKIV